MDLLTNAIESIRLGVEDYQNGSHARLIAAVRNIHAGVLLLYKEALRRLSPADSNEVLVKAQIVPRVDGDGALIFVGTGTKTVDSRQIHERFEGLGIETNWKAFDEITRARNDIEHYYPKLSQQALQRVVSSALAIIRAFVAKELSADPRALLGESTWQVMLTVAEIYEAEQKLCLEAIEQAEWPSEVVKNGLSSVSCSACGSDLLEPQGQSESWQGPILVCRACGTAVEPDGFVPDAVRSALAREMYLSVKDGDDIPYTHCPECGEDTYVVSEQRCVLCGISVDDTCVLCGNSIPPEEIDSSPYCSWCAHQAAKDD